MYDILWLIPALPFLGALILTLFGLRIPQKAAGVIGVGSVGISAILTLLIGFQFLSAPPEGHGFTQVLWNWMAVGDFSPDFALHLDALSLVFIFVITFVGFLIHLFSAEFMWEEEGYNRFFASMNLFVGSMLMLVLANNLALVYLGWEGVGLCSYLLIGFYYKETENGLAAQKAFIVTRIGDTAMGIGLFLLFASLSTLNLQEIISTAPQQWSEGSIMASAAALLILGGAVGKSAQLPLQTWLPDAMAGPSPVSALIHAATMVTAGVYIIARTFVIFELAPIVMTVVAVIGAATLLIAGFTAITQWDIKRVLAYSTISQIGYMFLALGVGAWSAAIFHFMIHAFFKALLFLGAGSIIVAMHDEHDMFKMRGLRKELPVTFWTFLIGSGALAALPLITAGFYSKDMILWYAWSSDAGSTWLWAAGFIGAFITAVYTFRMVFVTFWGQPKWHDIHKYPGPLVKTPLVILGVLSLIGGFIELPHTLGHLPLFSHFMHSFLPEVHGHGATSTEAILQIVTAITALVGVYYAYSAFAKPEDPPKEWSPSGLHRFFYSGWGFDALYNTLFVRPFAQLSRINQNDVIDLIYSAIVYINRFFHHLLSATQTGRLRWYAAAIVFGGFITVTIILFL